MEDKDTASSLAAALRIAVVARGSHGCILYLDARTLLLHLCCGGPPAAQEHCNAVLGTLVHGLACQAASASLVFQQGTLTSLFSMLLPGLSASVYGILLAGLSASVYGASTRTYTGLQAQKSTLRRARRLSAVQRCS